jgi:hypothetical protein
MEPIVRAVEGGDVEEVARLLDAEPHLMEGGDHDDDPSPLILAAERGHVGVVRLLLERGADVNFRSDYGYTALYEAAERGHEEVVSILLGCGADPSSKDGTGSTPLMGACCEGHLSVARQLLQHMQGRGLDERDDEGSTALWWACCRGHVEILRALLLAGVHHTIAERYGRTPRQAAQARGHAECVALLEVSGACILIIRRHQLSHFAPCFHGSGGRGSWSVAMWCIGPGALPSSTPFSSPRSRQQLLPSPLSQSQPF